MKKTEFYRAYQSKGTHRMYCDIMHDPTLRASAEILTRVTKPLHNQYQDDLTAQQQGLEKILDWQVRRCLGSSFAVVQKIMAVVASPKLCKAMRLSPRCDPPLPFNTTVLEEDFMLINKAFLFGVHLAGNYGWSEMLHRLTLPLAANTLLATDRSDRKRGMSNLKKMVEAIIKAENMVMAAGAGGVGELSSCLKDLAFPDETFAREIMVHIKRGNYSLESPHTAQAVAAMKKISSGSSSTKEILESTFGHLAHVVAKNSTNKSMSAHNLWAYLTSSPFIRPSGMPQHLPCDPEWTMLLQEYGLLESDRYKRYTQSFKGSSSKVPTAPDMQFPKNAQGVVKTQWRMSGPASHYRSSAAMAFLIHDAPNDFQHCDVAWAGQPMTNIFTVSISFTPPMVIIIIIVILLSAKGVSS